MNKQFGLGPFILLIGFGLAVAYLIVARPEAGQEIRHKPSARVGQSMVTYKDVAGGLNPLGKCIVHSLKGGQDYAPMSSVLDMRGMYTFSEFRQAGPLGISAPEITVPKRDYVVIGCLVNRL